MKRRIIRTDAGVIISGPNVNVVEQTFVNGKLVQRSVNGKEEKIVEGSVVKKKVDDNEPTHNK